MSNTFEFILVCVCVGGGGGGRGGGGLFFLVMLCVGCFGGIVLYVCTEYHVQVDMYHVSAQGVDECMINVHN